MLRNVDKKKRKLEKKMQELEDQLSNQQSYRRQLEREFKDKRIRSILSLSFFLDCS
jgi:hypothetical protein